MFKTALTKNIIPHTCKLANIVPLPKTQQRHKQGYLIQADIHPLSNCKGTGEEPFPYITANIPNTPMQHGYKTQHSTVTTLNNTVAKWFNQMAPPARTITVALDMRKAFDIINIHALIIKLLQTNIPGTIIKFITNYIKGRKAYTTYRNHTSRRQFKIGVPQGGVLSPTPFTPQIHHHPVHQLREWPTTSPSHPQARVQPINTYNHTYIQFFTWTKQNNLIYNPELHSVHAGPCRIYEQCGPDNEQLSTTHSNALKGFGSYLRVKTHIQHTHPQHLSTRIHISTNHKNTHCNKMG